MRVDRQLAGCGKTRRAVTLSPSAVAQSPSTVTLSEAKGLQFAGAGLNHAEHLQYRFEKKQLQILRCAQDDN